MFDFLAVVSISMFRSFEFGFIDWWDRIAFALDFSLIFLILFTYLSLYFIIFD